MSAALLTDCMDFETPALFRSSRLVLAHGVFDILHVGHIKHLQAARMLGDRLIVSITSDRYVNKGPTRPVFTAELRADALRALACVDDVVINDHATAIGLIGRLRPSVFVKGSEYRDKMTPMLLAERDAVEAIGGELVFTDEIEFHSTDIMRQILCA